MRTHRMVATAAVAIVFLLDSSSAADPTSLASFVGLAEASAGGGQTAAPTPQSAARPRTADGKPDLSGIWQVMNSAAWDIQDHSTHKGVPAGQGVVEGNEIPYRPEALAKKKQNYDNRITADPETKCFLPGVPRATYLPFPFQIIQSPTLVTILYEYAHTVRNIFMNTPHISGRIYWWMGDSRGHWEDKTLVIETTNMNGRWWFDSGGHFASDAVRVVERLTMVDADTIHYQATLEDPKVYTRPWTMVFPLERMKEKGYEQMEEACHEGDRDAAGFLLGGFKPYLGPRFPK